MTTWIIVGAFLSALAVAVGAFGAHGLKTKVNPEDLALFEMGVRYQMYHALGLVLIGITVFHFPENVINSPAILLTAGIITFLASLYILVLTNARWLGAITPIGGLLFLAGWFLLAFNLYKS